MVDVNKTDKKYQKLEATIKNVRRFADPAEASSINKADFLFDKNMTKRELGYVEKNDSRYLVHLNSSLFKNVRDVGDQAGILDHEYAHISFTEKNKSYGNSKQEELYAFSQEEKFKQKFWKSRGVAYKPHSKEEIKERLDKIPEYRCLPDTPPKSKIEAIKANLASGVCEAKKGIDDYKNDYLNFGGADRLFEQNKY